jgi:hypothetical protein
MCTVHECSCETLDSHQTFWFDLHEFYANSSNTLRLYGLTLGNGRVSSRQQDLKFADMKSDTVSKC